MPNDVSHMGNTEVVFVVAGVNVDSQNYCDKVLTMACWPPSERDVAFASVRCSFP